MMFGRCPWYVAGPLLGLVIVGLRAAVNKPFGALGGYIDVVENAASPRRFGFRAFVFLGLVLGGLVYALTSSSFGGALVATPLPGGAAAQVAWLVLAGVVMGLGARIAGGCTSGHGMTGMSLGSPASLVSTMTFFATAVGAAQAMAWIGGGR
jgi:uncharacterized membrane protein YedE/YeeE